MSEQPLPDHANIDDVDASGQPIGLEQVTAPQQVPMGNDAGGPDVAGDDDEPSPEELSVQGGDA